MSCCNATPYNRLQLVLYYKCSYTAHATKQCTGLYRRFSCDLPHSTAYNTRPTQAAIIPSAPRWSVSQRRNTSSAYQIPAPHRTLYRPAQPPYYNKVYKGAGVRLLWVHAKQCSIPQTMQARRGQLLPSADRWQVLTACQQYKPGAPAEGSASPPVQGQPGGVSILPTPGGLRSGTDQRSGCTGWHPPPGGRRGTTGGLRRNSFRAFAR